MVITYDKEDIFNYPKNSDTWTELYKSAIFKVYFFFHLFIYVIEFPKQTRSSREFQTSSFPQQS